MEIQPLRSHHLPRYAAALAAVVTAGMLTGCRTAGEVATEGTAPDPNTSYHSVVELDGDVAVEPSDPVNTDEPCTGDDTACEPECLTVETAIAAPSDPVNANEPCMGDDTACEPKSVTTGETQQVDLVGIAPVRVEP